MPVALAEEDAADQTALGFDLEFAMGLLAAAVGWIGEGEPLVGGERFGRGGQHEGNVRRRERKVNTLDNKPSGSVVNGLDMRKSEIAEYLGKIGKKGGSVKSKRKREASRKNLEKALSKRWGKKIRLFDRKRMK